MNTKIKSLLALAVVPVAFLSPASADIVSVEDRLTRLEAALERIEARMNDPVPAASLAPVREELTALSKDLGWNGKSASALVRPGAKTKALSVGGFLHLHAESDGTPDARYNGLNSRFIVRRARLTVKGTFAENFDFTMQSDFGANTLGSASGYRAQLTDLFVGWNKHPAARVQLGQFKVPFGYEQLLSDTKTLTVERSLPNDRLTLGRQIGLGLSGTVADKRVSYSAGVFNGNGVNNGANDNNQFLTAARASAVLWKNGPDGLTFGANALTGRETGASFTGRRTAWGVDAQLALRGWELEGEYLHLEMDRDSGADTLSSGWYLQAARTIDAAKLWQAVVRFENYDANTALANQVSENWMFGVNYRMKGDDIKLTLGWLLGDPAGSAGSDGRLLSRFQLIF
ncbi:MAG TPA: porin [Opitutaceae bacterium]|nr:porin [Opitutaceae bacterium]